MTRPSGSQPPVPPDSLVVVTASEVVVSPGDPPPSVDPVVAGATPESAPSLAAGTDSVLFEAGPATVSCVSVPVAGVLESATAVPAKAPRAHTTTSAPRYRVLFPSPIISFSSAVEVGTRSGLTGRYFNGRPPRLDTACKPQFWG